MIPIVSVVTAVYNDEKYIRKSIESILHQTFDNFEYLVVDDGSTDKTLEILEEIAKLDKRVKILTQKNSGAAAARNLAMHVAKGKYIALQDSDDISLPKRIEMQVNQLQQSPYNLISCTSHSIIDTNDNIITTSNKVYKNINDNILNGRLCFCHPTMMLSKELLLKVNGYNFFYRKSEDFDLILRLIENNGYVDKINMCLYNYRIREDSEGSKNNGAFTKRVYENYLNRKKNKPENFTLVDTTYKTDKDFILKRHAKEIFYSENYSQYIKLYKKGFHKLPVKEYLLFFIYSLLPPTVKKIIKKMR